MALPALRIDPYSRTTERCQLTERGGSTHFSPALEMFSLLGAATSHLVRSEDFVLVATATRAAPGWEDLPYAACTPYPLRTSGSRRLVLWSVSATAGRAPAPGFALADGIARLGPAWLVAYARRAAQPLELRVKDIRALQGLSWLGACVHRRPRTSRYHRAVSRCC